MNAKRWDWIIDLVRFHGYSIGAEIGVYRGRTTFAVMNACPKLRLIAVDRWEYIPKNTPDAIEIGLAGNDMESAYRGYMRKVHLYRNRLTVLRGNSVEMVKKVEDGSLDFVFIDADHRYQEALKDIKAWSPKVKEDGTVCGHDYEHPRFPGVTKAVIECFGDNHGYGGVDHVWYAKKEDFIL